MSINRLVDKLINRESKILLINPRNVAWCGGTSSGPLGLAYLAAIIEEENRKVGLVDRAIERDKDIKDEIEKYEIIAISACTSNIKDAWHLAELAKDYDRIVILGGPHPTALPTESLERGCIDVVVRGEGEVTVKELLKGKSLEDIKGISYRKNGEIIHNPDRDYIQDLDSIPFPDRHLFNLKKYISKFHRYSRVENLLTSRGCPCDCNFCYKETFGWRYRVRSPKNVIEEWKQILDMGRKEINIIDDNFSVNEQRAIEICDMIVGNGLKIDWTAAGGLRVDCISKRLLQSMKRSGCYRVSLGAESGSQYILDRVGKRIKLGQIKDTVRLAKEIGLETIVFFMIGNLYETNETMQATIDFAVELDPDLAQFTIVTPYPGTKLYEIVKREGCFLITDWERYGSYEKRAYFEHGELKGDAVERMYKKAYRSYYIRPKVALKYLRRKRFEILRDFHLLDYLRFLR